jgi:AraC-like DNA-binding protein
LARSIIPKDGVLSTAICQVKPFEDASHFTREYKRLFGAPPMRDVEQLREGASKRVRQAVVRGQ